MRTQIIGMIALVRKETGRVLRIWVQTLTSKLLSFLDHTPTHRKPILWWVGL